MPNHDAIFIALEAGHYQIALYLADARKNTENGLWVDMVAYFLRNISWSDVHTLQYFIEHYRRHIDNEHNAIVNILFCILCNAIDDGHLHVMQHVMTTYSELFAIVLPRLTSYFKHLSFDAYAPSLRQLCCAVLLNHQAPVSSFKTMNNLRAMEVRAGEALDRVYALSHPQ
jgi:hypothetical protein